MHSTTVSSSSTSSTTTTNHESYHYPPISTLRRASRPTPICYIKQTNNQQQHIQQTSHPYTASFHYQPQQEQHIQLPSQHHNIHVYQQQTHQQQQQAIIDPYSQHQHTPHTFPLQGSPNHYHQYFYFPPSNLQVGVTSNGHQTTSSHNNRLHAVQMQEQQKWSNPVLSPLMVKRMNENATSMPIDDDEDPSASIDALVADVDSSPHSLLDDQQNKSRDESKPSLTTPAGTISPSPHLYHRRASHILTTPPNPLASDNHPDNQLTVGNNFQKIFSPIRSAGFELANNNNNKSNSTNRTAFFDFESTISQQTDYKNQHNENLVDDNEEDQITKPLIINTDVRTMKISSNNLIQDDNSNQSSTNSSCHNTSSRMFSQVLQSSEQQRLSSSSPLSTDMKLSPLDSGNNQTNNKSMQNGHLCTHPDCNKIFANKSALAKHKLTHSQDRKHQCSKCNKGFKRLDHLHGHMLTHEEEKPHKCRVPNCNRTYCDARSLKRHIENVHQDILAAIHSGGHDAYKKYLPETACVKTKDLSINNEFSMDSIDSNSPHSSIDNEQPFNIRASTGTKTVTTYTFDEEKCVECHLCKKPFKNGAALNGHMRLHGGFNEKQPSSSSSVDTTQKRKRLSTGTTKRKRTDSPSSTSISIKSESQDIPIMSSINDFYTQSSFADVQQLQDRTLSSRARSVSSSIIPTTSNSFSYTIKNPMSVQPPTKQNRNENEFDQSRLTQFHPIGDSQRFPNSQFDNDFRKTSSTENYSPNQQTNGISSYHLYNRSSSQQSSNLSHYPTTSLPTNLLQRLLRQRQEMINPDLYFQHQQSSSFNDQNRYTPSPNYVHSPIQNPTSSIVNTPVTSPYSNANTSHTSPISTSQICNNNTIMNSGMQSSPATSSSSSSSSLTSHTAPKKRILKAVQQESQDDTQQRQPEAIVGEEPSSPPTVLKIIPDTDSPVKRKGISGFLIGTPSSTGASSSSSTSSHTHFTYDNILPEKKRESTPSPFNYPSQFRRQLSLNIGSQTNNPIPSTPYTPPPMLSPFRKGPGLYYRVFSQPGTSTDTPSIPTTPIGEESTNPKINIGRDYQASIPKLRTDIDETYDRGDELLCSPLELSYPDEKTLEKFEQLIRMNPFLFSPRHSPTSYPLELVYMLFYEYNGDLQRTLDALLQGTAKDIKQCRPLHRYRFLECDNWTKDEIDAFTKAIKNSEKNFEFISRVVGTKTIKQCIEFHYMPKVSLTARKILPTTRTTAVITRRKRVQMVQAKQLFDDETSSSSFNELRLDEDGNSDSSSTVQFICDIDDCLQTFSTERACRAHRKDHRRPTNNMTVLTSTKRSRNIDLNK